MGFSQLRVFLAFISGAIFMLFTLTMMTQQMFVFQRHPHSTLTTRNQAVIQKNAVYLSLHALKAAPRTTVTDSESNGIAEKKLSGKLIGSSKVSDHIFVLLNDLFTNINVWMFISCGPHNEVFH